MFLFVRTIHASLLIHSLLPSPLSLELSSESDLSNVIYSSCSLDFDQVVLLGLNWLPIVWLIPPCKSTRPKGVPRHQLAPRNDGASSSSSRPDPQAEIQRISAELAQATRVGLWTPFRWADYRSS